MCTAACASQRKADRIRDRFHNSWLICALRVGKCSVTIAPCVTALARDVSEVWDLLAGVQMLFAALLPCMPYVLADCCILMPSSLQEQRCYRIMHHSRGA